MHTYTPEPPNLKQQRERDLAAKRRATNSKRLTRAMHQLQLILASYESNHNQYREEYGLMKAAHVVLTQVAKWL